MEAKNKELERILQEENVTFSVKSGIIIVKQALLFLSKKGLTSVSHFYFKGKDLDLSNNKLTNLDEFKFKGKELDLSHNRINTLDGFYFYEEWLDLDDNQITNLDGFRFKGDELYLYDNPLNSNVEGCGEHNRTIYSYRNGRKKICAIGCSHVGIKETIKAINKKYEGQEAKTYIAQVRKSLSFI